MTGRIFRDTPADATEFSFSYRSPHDPDDDTDYDPERYGLAILRLAEPVDNPDPQPDTGYRYAALVIEPKGLFVREWQDDQLLGELASYNVDSEAETWYDVRVAYSGTNDRTITVFHAKQGEPLKQAMSVQITLPEAEGQRVGFGTGELGEYEFRDILFKLPSSTEDTILAVNHYDALGRRIAQTLDPAGTPQVTEYYYDGQRVIEERDGSGNVVAT